MIYKIRSLLYALLHLLLFSKVDAYTSTDYLYEINSWHGSLYKKKNAIYLIGTGGAIPYEKVEKFMLHYQVYCAADLNKTRQLLVHMTEDLIKKLNDDPRAKLYMANYPATCRNASITVAFNQKDCSYYPMPYIAYAFIARGRLFYRVYDPTTKNVIESFEEPYDEARRIVLEQESEHSVTNQ